MNEIEIKFTPQERDLNIDHTFADPGLTKRLKDKCSIRVNNQWRIIFIWDDERGEADGIYLDNHTYK